MSFMFYMLEIIVLELNDEDLSFYIFEKNFVVSKRNVFESFHQSF